MLGAYSLLQPWSVLATVRLTRRVQRLLRSINCVCLSVCLSVRTRVCISGLTRSHFIEFSVRVVYGRGSILLRWRCNTLCTSGFADDVVFSYNGPYGGVTLLQQPHCSVGYGHTPLLCGIASSPGWRLLPRLDESYRVVQKNRPPNLFL